MPREVNDLNLAGPVRVFLDDSISDSLGKHYLPVARTMFAKTDIRAKAGNLDTLIDQHTFYEDGVTVRVGYIGGMPLIYILPFKEDHRSISHQPGYGVPLYSGVLRNSYYEVKKEPYSGGEVEVAVNNDFLPTESTAKLLKGVHDSLEGTIVALENSPSLANDVDLRKALAKARLTVRYTHTQQSFLETPYHALKVPNRWSHRFDNPVQPPAYDPNRKMKVYAQHRLIKPTMYSGRMRIVAQLVMGYGTTDKPTDEQMAVVQNVDDIEHAPVRETYEHFLPDVDDTEKKLGSMNYWFLWEKTHGIYKTPGGRYYLIEISQRGVYAMRLPVFPDSISLPDEAKDHLHAMPTGYGFPRSLLSEHEKNSGVTETPFDKALRDGWVRQILPPDAVAEYFTNLRPTYGECGWAFNMTGNKADNVGWKLFGPRPYDYKVFEHWRFTFEGGDLGENKMDYLHADAGFDHSIDSLKCSFAKIGSGNVVDTHIYNQAFKIPFLDDKTGIPGVISFKTLPQQFPTSGTEIPPDYKNAMANYPVSDTVVHVFYDGDELVWIRYYNPMNTNKLEHDSWDDRDFVPYCMLLGGFTWGNYSRDTKPPKSFYSNRVDPRKIADESRLDVQSVGRKTWESPYMGVAYSYPYPPFHFGYEQSNSENEWFNDFDASYVSHPGSPWTAKRHCFHVHVTGQRITGQSYEYALAIPFTEREAGFICEKHNCATRDKINYQYAAMVMQYVYYTYPSWIPDPNLPIDKGIIPVGNWAWWQLRDDTVKYLVWKYFEDDQNYTKEVRQAPQTVLNIVGGTHTAPLDVYNKNVAETAVEEYKVYTLCSKHGGEYPLEMKGSSLWGDTLPMYDGSLDVAHLWCTRSMLGNEAHKQHIYLNGAMDYAGTYVEKMDEDTRKNRVKQITFVGVI